MRGRMTATTHCNPTEAEAEILARASWYRLLSRVFADPAENSRATSGEIEIATAGAELLGEEKLAGALRGLSETLPPAEGEAREGFARVFGFLVGGPAPHGA